MRLFGTTFDTLYPVGTAFDIVADALLTKLGESCTCSEDDERYTRTCGAVEMLEVLVKNGLLTLEAARSSMRDIWLRRGLEEEAEEESL